MYTYIISYDLMSPVQDYDRIRARLRKLGSVQTQLSVWILKHSARANAIGDDLKTFIDSNDRLLVYGSPDNWASLNALNRSTIQKDIAA